MKRVKSKFLKVVVSIILASVCLFSLTGCADMLNGILGSIGIGDKTYKAEDITAYLSTQGYETGVYSQKALQTTLGGVKNCKSFVVASKPIGGGDYSNISIYIFESKKDCAENFDKLGKYIQDYEHELLENFTWKENIAFFGTKQAVDLMAGLS